MSSFLDEATTFDFVVDFDLNGLVRLYSGLVVTMALIFAIWFYLKNR